MAVGWRLLDVRGAAEGACEAPAGGLLAVLEIGEDGAGGGIAAVERRKAENSENSVGVVVLVVGGRNVITETLGSPVSLPAASCR